MFFLSSLAQVRSSCACDKPVFLKELNVPNSQIAAMNTNTMTGAGQPLVKETDKPTLQRSVTASLLNTRRNIFFAFNRRALFLMLAFLAMFSVAELSQAAVDLPIDTYWIQGNGTNVWGPQSATEEDIRFPTLEALANYVKAKTSSSSIFPGGGTWTLIEVGPSYYSWDVTWTDPNDELVHEALASVSGNEFSTCPSGYSQNGPDTCGRDSTLDTEKELGPSCDGLGDPCNPSNGNLYQIETDYRDPNDTVSLVRTYNSLALSNDGVNSNSYLINRDSGLGIGWSFKPQLEINSYPNSSIAVYIRARNASGRTQPYALNSNGDWDTDADNTDRLTKNASGYTLSKANGITERYDLSGKILSIIDKRNQSTTYNYDTSGQLQSIRGPFGQTISFTFVDNHVDSVTDPVGKVTHYTYDANYRLVRVTYPDNTARKYYYENPSFPDYNISFPYALTGVALVNDSGVETRITTFGYDAQGRSASTQHTGGYDKYTLEINAGYQTTTTTDAVGTREIRSYTSPLGVGLLNSKENLTDGKILNQTFDDNGNLSCRQDEEGHVTTYVYNATNQKQSETAGQTGDCYGPMSTTATRTTTYQYLSPTLTFPTVIESPSVAGGSSIKRTTIGYTDSRFPTQPTTITQTGFTPTGQPLSRAVSLGYNARGQVSTINGPRLPSDPGMAGIDDITTLVYNDCTTGGGCGQLYSITNALGQTTTYNSYYADGRLQQSTDPNGLVTSYTYDNRGRIATINQSTGTGMSNSRTFTYTPDGQIKTLSISPDNLIYTYTYDDARYLRIITDNLGNRVDYAYDLKGNHTTTVITNPDGSQAQSLVEAYDLRNHVQSINHGGNLTTLVNDAVGNLTQEIDPNHTAISSTVGTVNAYDSLNRLFQTTNELNGITKYTYDVNDRLKKVTAPNTIATTYTYDDLGNLLQEVSPDRGTTKYTYDAAGNLLTQLDARNVLVTYTYDALNRLTLADYPGTANDTAYTYDNASSCTYGIGRLCRTMIGSLTTTYNYNGFGSPTDRTQTLAGGPYTTHTDRDSMGRVIGMTYPSGRQVTTTRDAKGRVSTISATVNGVLTPLINNRVYQADDQLASQTFGNGVIDTRLYTNAGRLYNQFIGSADTRVYSYDYNGNLKNKQTLPEVADYIYDALNRLTADTDPTPLIFTYDANGNRKTGAGVTITYTTNTNRLATIAGKTVTLSPNGNLTTDPVNNLTYTYNNANELATATQSGSLIGTYGYDPQHLRISKVSAEGSIVYHYDDSGHLLQETTSSGVLIRAYVWADELPIAQITKTPTGETLVYLHTDNLNALRLATNTTGQVVWRWEGNAFGDNYPNEDPGNTGVKTTVNLRYPGQYYDKETGLHYNWNRYYDPRLGRYITSDPIGLIGGLNTYSYVEGNPLSNTDSMGLDGDISIHPPSFFDLTTISALRRGNTLDQAVRDGALTRSVTLPAVGTALIPDAAGLAGTMLEVGVAACRAIPETIPNVAEACKNPLLAVVLGANICGNIAGTVEGSSRSYLRNKETIEQITEASSRVLRRNTGSAPKP